MYSGTTLHNSSGNIVGAHQKIDRSARRILEDILPEDSFPPIGLILHFEGKNGPDGVKRKSPAQDEPWHYYEPRSTNNRPFLDLLIHHYTKLVEELRTHDLESTAFEAAWFAHALVDGLTPAHHYPYEKELIKLRGGESLETRTTIKEKLFIGGESTFDTLSRNWQMWGTKGLMTTHGSFEIGVAMIIAARRYRLKARPSTEELENALTTNIVKLFEDAARDIDTLQMYQEYYALGWTKKLTREVNKVLIPRIIKTVVLAWYKAIYEAQHAA
jgi:hypothetical protein